MGTNRDNLRRAIWAICDQGFLSIGNFIVTIQLARHLPPAQYGEFALLLSFFLICQLVNFSLILYPLTLSIAGGKNDTPRTTISNAFLLVGASTLTLASFTVLGLAVLGYEILLFPACTYLIFYLILDAVRRVFLAQFRYRTVVAGSIVTSVCQIFAVTVLAWTGTLTLASGLYAMAAAYAAGISTITWKVRPEPPSTRNACHLILTFWRNGKWAFANGLVLALRGQMFTWALAIVAGPTSVAGFQAVMNVANLTNPIITGLNNAIPQAAAQALSRSSVAEAWATTRGYVMVGVPFVFGYCALVAMVPDHVLRGFYGVNSAYLDFYSAVRIIMLATAANYLAEMICTFLHGIGHGRVALWMNGSGLVVAVLSLPLVTLYGVSGACTALALANAVRLGGSYFLVYRMGSDSKYSLVRP